MGFIIYKISNIIWIDYFNKPYMFFTDISKMRFVNTLSICASIYSILVIMIETPWFYIYYLDNVYDENGPIAHANWHDMYK